MNKVFGIMESASNTLDERRWVRTPTRTCASRIWLLTTVSPAQVVCVVSSKATMQYLKESTLWQDTEEEKAEQEEKELERECFYCGELYKEAENTEDRRCRYHADPAFKSRIENPQPRIMYMPQKQGQEGPDPEPVYLETPTLPYGLNPEFHSHTERLRAVCEALERRPWAARPSMGKEAIYTCA